MPGLLFSPGLNLLDTVHSGGPPPSFPGERNKTYVILLRSLGLFIGQPYQLPHRTAAPSTRHLGGFVTVLALNKIMVLLRSPF